MYPSRQASYFLNGAAGIPNDSSRKYAAGPTLSVRQLRQNPGFAGTAIVVLALGVAASAAIFAFVDAALLQPLPYHNASRLVVAYEITSSCLSSGPIDSVNASAITRRGRLCLARPPG